MKLLLKLTILIITAGCTLSGKPTFQEKIDKYADEFYIDFPYAIETVIRSERTIGEGLHGRCMPDAKVSIVNPYSTLWLSDGQIQFLVYHELAHCALDLAHNRDTTVMGGSPFPKTFTIRDVIELRKYHKEMCQGKFPGVRKLAFGKQEPLHISCFYRNSIEKWEDE